MSICLNSNYPLLLVASSAFDSQPIRHRKLLQLPHLEYRLGRLID